MPQSVRRWLRGVLAPLHIEPDKWRSGPPNFSRLPSFDDPETGVTAYWTWLKDATSNWTIVVRVPGELHFPLDREYGVEVSLLVADQTCTVIVPNVPIPVGVRCAEATIRVDPWAA